MNIRPEEATLLRALLAHLADPSAPPPPPMAVFAFESRLSDEAPPLGEHVFQLKCKLWADAAKEIAAVSKARKDLRETLGKKRLSKGEGPERVVPLGAPTLNEYNGMKPFQKEELRAEFDAAIETLKRDWPAWSCGSVDRLVPKKKGSPEKKLQREGGRRRAVVVTRASVRRPDEESLDAHLGAKIPIDRLVQAGVLRDDSHDWLVRYGVWTPAPIREGWVLVDVYEIAPC